MRTLSSVVGWGLLIVGAWFAFTNQPYAAIIPCMLGFGVVVLGWCFDE